MKCLPGLYISFFQRISLVLFRYLECRTPSRDALQVMRDARDSISSVIIHGESIVAASIDGAIRTYDVRNSRLITDGLGRKYYTSLINIMFDVKHVSCCSFFFSFF